MNENKTGIVQVGCIKEYGQQGSIYSSNGILPSNLATHYKNPIKIIDDKQEEVMNEQNKDNRYTEALQILRQKIGEEAFSEWAFGGLWCILQEVILRQDLYEEELFKDWKDGADVFKRTYYGSPDKCFNNKEEKMRDMWENWKIRCSPQGWGLSEQQYRELASFMSELSQQDTSKERCLCDLWETTKGIRLLQQTLFEIQKIWESVDDKKVQWENNHRKYRIRKLTPTTCWKLMGWQETDVLKAKAVAVSDSQLYKQAGNGIVTNCVQLLMEHLYKAQYNNTYKCTDENFIQPQSE